MRLAELRTAVRSQGGFDVADSVVEGWLNQRYRELVAQSGWLETDLDLGLTVAGQAEYALPASVADFSGMTVSGVPYTRVGQKDLWQLRSGQANLSGSGGVFAPDFSAQGVPQLELYPAPGESGNPIRALCSLIPPDLSSDTLGTTDIPVIPEDFTGALIDGAIALGLARIDERLDEADRYERLFEREVGKLLIRRNSRIGSGASQMQVKGYHF